MGVSDAPWMGVSSRLAAVALCEEREEVPLVRREVVREPSRGAPTVIVAAPVNCRVPSRKRATVVRGKRRVKSVEVRNASDVT